MAGEEGGVVVFFGGIDGGRWIDRLFGSLRQCDVQQRDMGYALQVCPAEPSDDCGRGGWGRIDVYVYGIRRE